MTKEFPDKVWQHMVSLYGYSWMMGGSPRWRPDEYDDGRDFVQPGVLLDYLRSLDFDDDGIVQNMIMTQQEAMDNGW